MQLPFSYRFCINLRFPLALLVWATLLSPTFAQPSPSIPVVPSIQPSEEDGYLLGAGDRIRIDFFSIPEFSGEYQVLPNGTVNLPYIGAVSVQGKTLRQASSSIVARAKPYLSQPVITISLIAARPVTIAIAGEVNRPGSYTISTSGSTSGEKTVSTENTVPSLTRALELAEGITQAADLRQVQIRRRRSTNFGSDEIISVNLQQLVQSADGRQDLRLRDGDSIFIPPASDISLAEVRQNASASFATKSNRPLKIVVTGEVNRPGPYTIAERGNEQQTEEEAPTSQVPSITQAIQVAGGITQSADIRNIQVYRLTKAGEKQARKVDFWKLLDGDILQDLPLQDGDTIEIPAATVIDDREIARRSAFSISPDKITINLVGEVERPGAVTVPPNTPLNQAVLAAGGFNRRARKSTVTLVRLNPNGTVSKRDISIDLAQGLSEQNNPALRNNDTVIVRKSTLTGISDTLSTITSPFSSIFGLFRLLGF